MQNVKIWSIVSLYTQSSYSNYWQLKCSTNPALAALLHWGKSVLGNSARGGSQNYKAMGIKATVCIIESMSVSMVVKAELKC